jgi:hypothetical protein
MTMTATIRALAQGSRLALLLGAALSLPACVVETQPYHPRGPYDDSYRYDRGQDQIDGFITAEGRCLTLRDHQSSQVYSLAGNTRDLRPGDHVLLSERETDGDPCGVHGPTLEVLRVDAVWKGDDHDSAYFDSRRDGDFETFISQNRALGGWYADRDNTGRDDNGEDEHEALRVDGRLDLRGSCPAIHTPDGVSYDLDGNLGDFHDGDRVRVIGVLQGRSACGGRTLEVNEIHPPER